MRRDVLSSSFHGVPELIPRVKASQRAVGYLLITRTGSDCGQSVGCHPRWDCPSHIQVLTLEPVGTITPCGAWGNWTSALARPRQSVVVGLGHMVVPG